MMARKKILTDEGEVEDFTTLIQRLPADTFCRMVRAVSSDLTPKDARDLCLAFKEFKG